MEKSRDLRKLISTEVQALVQLVRDTDICELKVEKGPFSVVIKPCGAEVSEPLRQEQVASQYSEQSEQSEQSEDEHISVTASMVGIFHRASTPFEAPLIEAGKDVARGQIIGYIESMRLMHELRSPCAGRVMKIAVEENEPVDYGKLILEVTAA